MKPASATMNSSAVACRVHPKSVSVAHSTRGRTMTVVATVAMTRKASSTPLTRSSSRYPPANSSAAASAITSDAMTGSGSSGPKIAAKIPAVAAPSAA